MTVTTDFLSTIFLQKKRRPHIRWKRTSLFRHGTSLKRIEIIRDLSIELMLWSKRRRIVFFLFCYFQFPHLLHQLWTRADPKLSQPFFSLSLMRLKPANVKCTSFHLKARLQPLGARRWWLNHFHIDAELKALTFSHHLRGSRCNRRVNMETCQQTPFLCALYAIKTDRRLQKTLVLPAIKDSINVRKN